MARIVTAVYYDSEAADAARKALADAGIPGDAVKVESTQFSESDGTSLLSATGAPDFALYGAVIGAVGGGLAAMITFASGAPLGRELLGPWWVSALARGILGGGGLGLMIGFVLGLGQWEAEDEPVTTPKALPATLLSVSDPEWMAVAREVFWKNAADQISG